jgi:hypothetical protein
MYKECTVLYGCTFLPIHCYCYMLSEPSVHHATKQDYGENMLDQSETTLD